MDYYEKSSGMRFASLRRTGRRRDQFDLHPRDFLRLGLQHGKASAVVIVNGPLLRDSPKISDEKSADGFIPGVFRQAELHLPIQIGDGVYPIHLGGGVAD